ncbi:MAG: MFS transporter [Chloroflexia bacterium]|nr:MFS transporter [Chloroflexia bacterium]
MIQRLARGRIHYAWIVAAVTFITMLGASGFRSTPGVLIIPLEEAFGWSRATISLAVSVNLLLFGFMGPFAAALMERFGIRRVVVVALLAIAAGSALTALISAPWQLIALWGLVVGLGTGTMAAVLGATVANRWFVARRGLVVGLLTAAGATGQLIFLPVLAWLATERGWQWVSIVVAMGALLVVPLVVVFMRGRPSDVGLLPYGATKVEPLPAVTGNPIANAFRGLALASGSRNFWLLAAGFFICGASTNGLIGTHLIPAAMDHGMVAVAAASMLAVIGIFDIIGTTLSGWLTDRWDSRKLLFMYYGLRGLSLLFLPAAFGSPNFGLILFIVFYGLDWIATVPPTVALTADSFGRANATIVFGWIFASHMVGAAAAASAAGAIRTWFGDYQMAFIGAGLLCLLAAYLSLQIRPGLDSGRATEPMIPLDPRGPLVQGSVAGRR